MTIAENLLSKLRKLKDASVEDDVDLPQYIQCWDDINQILGIMGSVFRFVKSDVEDKVKILKRIHEKYEYSTINFMMVKEKENNLINYKYLDEKNPSGSRTLLRLHRALKMVAQLLYKISINAHNGKMSSIAYDSYHESPMPPHHPWVVRKAIGAAVYTLTDTKSFCETIAPGEGKEILNPKLDEAAALMNYVFDNTDSLFVKHELDTIP